MRSVVVWIPVVLLGVAFSGCGLGGSKAKRKKTRKKPEPEKRISEDKTPEKKPGKDRPLMDAFLREEIKANESAAISSCKLYSDGQDIYRRIKSSEGIKVYAQSLRGKDGLCTRVVDGKPLKLVSVAMANAEGNPSDKPTPHRGYCFKVLTGQGPKAVGGRKSYVYKGYMTGGYAFLAYPAQYGKTGKRTFQLNFTGTIYAKDLGKDTARIIEQMTEYNPDRSWEVAD